MKWSSKSENTYDGSNRLTETVFSGWDWFYYEWLIYDKMEHFYDAKGNIREKDLRDYHIFQAHEMPEMESKNY